MSNSRASLFKRMTWRVLATLALSALFLFTLFFSIGASAHEVRPAYLKIEEVSLGEFDVSWKQPIREEYRLSIDPILPSDCIIIKPIENFFPADALQQQWRVQCPLVSGEIRIKGLSKTLTDVLVDMTRLDGTSLSAVLTPSAPALSLDDPTPALSAYFILGVEHLLMGYDHVLFVVGLVLLIRRKWMLLKTVTAFTVAHSITLALSTLDIMVLPSAPVEAVIALSILFLARELALPEQQRSSLVGHAPWVMAFIFGLLHGFGFAGALADLGLPQGQFVSSLFLFNLGIEGGQLLIVAGLLMLLWLVRQVDERRFAETGLVYAMGGVAAYLTMDRLILLW